MGSGRRTRDARLLLVSEQLGSYEGVFLGDGKKTFSPTRPAGISEAVAELPASPLVSL